MRCVHAHRGMHAIEDRVVQIGYEVLCKKLRKIIKRLGRLVEL
jgi:hypothetical protein